LLTIRSPMNVLTPSRSRLLLPLVSLFTRWRYRVLKGVAVGVTLNQFPFPDPQTAISGLIVSSLYYVFRFIERMLFTVPCNATDDCAA